MVTDILAGIMFAVVFAAGVWGWWYEVIGTRKNKEDFDTQQKDSKQNKN
ncbi:MAG: hypothetical protein IJ833_10820 [Lachnospiraceae bacterium]|nr:hypothetical protein [Lachnospiraceae bacterium]